MLPPSPVLLNRLIARCTLRHVQVLLMLAETGTARRAAEAVGVSPASLEHLLSELEDILETELFQRDGDAFDPLPACVVLLPHARQVMTGAEGCADALVAHDRQERIVVRVMAASAGASRYLAHALPAFMARYARVQVQLREAHGQDPAAAIERSEVDLVAGPRPAAIPEGWRFHELLTDRFAAVCAPDHPLAGETQTWDELSQQPWLLPPAGSAARERFEALMRHAGSECVSYCVVKSTDDMTDWILHDHEVLAFVPVADVVHLLLGGQLVQLRPEHPVAERLGLLQPLSCTGPTLRLAGFLQHLAATSPEAEDSSRHATPRGAYPRTAPSVRHVEKLVSVDETWLPS